MLQSRPSFVHRLNCFFARSLTTGIVFFTFRIQVPVILRSTSGGLMPAELEHHRIITFSRFVTTRHRHAENYKLIDELRKVYPTFGLRHHHAFTLVRILITQLDLQLIICLNPHIKISEATVARHRDGS
ncbi:MAG: hypothetical protein Q4P12_06045 [Bacteroidales bacterium]|nr:hypothetical protein [Bacteroidales bacterium]